MRRVILSEAKLDAEPAHFLARDGRPHSIAEHKAAVRGCGSSQGLRHCALAKAATLVPGRRLAVVQCLPGGRRHRGARGVARPVS